MKDWALILGASSGIGAECAKRLAKKGINIYGLYLRKKKSEIESLTAELSQYNVEVIYKKANASNDEKRLEIIEELKSKGNIRVKMFIHSIAFGTLKKMIGDNFASCINIIKDMKSYYKEDLKINAVSEVVLIIKTLKEFKEIEVYLNDNHPYDTPFIAELNTKKINTKYLEWISKNL